MAAAISVSILAVFLRIKQNTSSMKDKGRHEGDLFLWSNGHDAALFDGGAAFDFEHQVNH